MNPADLYACFDREPEQAVQYLRGKGYKIGWDWHETLDDAHARAFTVAKVARLDVLEEIRHAVTNALQSGQTYREFAQELTPTLQTMGWWGKQIIVDGAGNAEVAQLGSPRRLKTIYQTNLQSAYMAGRYQAMVAAASTHPYWQYVAVLDGKTRPSHRAMNGKVFRWDDPIWQYIFPPNGFNCRCRVTPLSEAAVKARGLTVEQSDGRMLEMVKTAGVDKRTGEVRQTSVNGIRVKGQDGKQVVFAPDPGFNNNPGADWQKPFTPPPLDDLPRTFPPDQSLPALPAPTPFDPAGLLPAGLQDADYVNAFLSKFGATIDHPALFFDAVDEPLLMTADLFKKANGAWKVGKADRAQYLPMMAEAIKDPDEIWMVWQPVKSQPFVLRRRYVKQFAIAGETQPGLAVFEEGEDGWAGITVFQVNSGYVSQLGYADTDAYINAQRGGFLVYRRRP